MHRHRLQNAISFMVIAFTTMFCSSAIALQVSWYCPNTAGIEPTQSFDLKLQKQRTGVLGMGNGTIAVDTQPIDDFLKKAGARGVDISDCVRDLANQNWDNASDEINQVCGAFEKLGSVKNCNREELVAPLRTHLLEQAQKYGSGRTSSVINPASAVAGSRSIAVPKQMMDKLKGSCSPPLSDGEASATLSADFLNSKMHDAFAGRDQDCKTALAQSLVNQLKIYAPSGCELGTKSPACAKFEKDSIEALAKFRNSLTAEIPSLESSLSIPCSSRSDAVQALQTLKSELIGSNSCDPISSGDEHTYPQDDATVAVPHSAYKIGRGPNRGNSPTYEARLNLNFQPQAGVDMAAFRKTIDACLKMVNEKGALRGPNGESLTIKIDDSTVAPRDVAVRTDGRANSLSWVQGLDCAAITHETLHHLGLCDHYRESTRVGESTETFGQPDETSQQRNYDCRVTSADDNVMSYQKKAFQRAGLAPVRMGCDCPASLTNSACQAKIFAGQTTGKCPAGFSNAPTDFQTDKPVDINYRVANRPTLFLNTTLPGGTSLLAPAQFRAILNPGCRANNKLYYTCVAPSYVTSSSKSGVACPTLPPECASGSDSWLK